MTAAHQPAGHLPAGHLSAGSGAAARPTAAPDHRTPRGAATRARIIEAAADLVLARGAAGTSLDDIRAQTATSKSQLFHYFPRGKNELVAEIAAVQAGRVLAAQRPYLDTLDTWAAWDGWRAAVLAHYGAQAHWGCPVGALAAEVASGDPALAAELAGHLEEWRGYLEAGLTRMRAAGRLRPETDPRALSLAMFAALQGGLLLTQTMQSAEPLAAALDGALAALHAAAAEPAGQAPATETS
jgi:AcrR family transcriptional regulator